MDRLPGTLEEAVTALAKDRVVMDALGTHVTSQYTAGKHREWEAYCAQVSQWELDRYLVSY